MKWRKPEYFGMKSKSCINDYMNLTNGAYQPFHRKNYSFPLSLEPINPCHLIGPTAYSRLTLRFLWKLVPWSTCAGRHEMGDADFQKRMQSMARLGGHYTVPLPKLIGFDYFPTEEIIFLKAHWPV